MADMTVLYLEATGQILAAVAPSVPFAEEPTVADLAGEHLVVRGGAGEADVLVPADELAAATIEFDRAVVADPTVYRHADGKAEAQAGAVIGLADTDSGGISFGGVVVVVDQNPQAIDATIEEAPAVWVLARTGINGGPQVSTAILPVDADHSTVLVPPLPPGTVDAVAVVTGYRSAVLTYPPSYTWPVHVV